MVTLVKHIFLALPNDLKMESKIFSVFLDSRQSCERKILMVFLKESTQIPAQKNNMTLEERMVTSFQI